LDASLKLLQIKDVSKDKNIVRTADISKYHLTKSNDLSLNGILTDESVFVNQYHRYRDSWVYYLLTKNYLEVNTIRVAINPLNNNEDKENIFPNTSSADEVPGIITMTVTAVQESDESTMTRGRNTVCATSGHSSEPPSTPYTSEISTYVSTAEEICRGLNYIEDLKIHTLMEIMYHSNPTSVVPMLSWNLRLWNDFYDALE